MTLPSLTVGDIVEMLRDGRTLMFAPIGGEFRAPTCLVVIGQHLDAVVLEGPRNIREQGRSIAASILSTLPFPGESAGWEA